MMWQCQGSNPTAWLQVTDRHAAGRGALRMVVQEFGLTAEGSLSSVNTLGDGKKQEVEIFKRGNFQNGWLIG